MNETYDIEKGQEYLDARDYYGYADYLGRCAPSNNANRSKINEKIKEYTRLGDIQQSILENATDDEKFAFGYINGMNGTGKMPGRYEDNNKFGKTYSDAINNLADKQGNKIDNIEVIFKKSDNFLNACNKLNTTEKDIYRKYGISVNKDSSNGNISLIIPTDNKKLPDILNSINYDFTQDVEKTKEDIKKPGVNNIDFYGYGISAELSMAGTKPKQSYIIRAINDKGDTIDSKNFNVGNLKDAVKTYNKAKKLYDKVLKSSQSENYDEKLNTTMFLGRGHLKAYELWKNGSINTTEYNNIVKARTEQFNTLLKQADLTQYNVYVGLSNDDDENFVLRPTDNPQRKEYMRTLSAAMEENRVTYSAGMVGGQLGTVITIAQTLDKDKKLIKEDAGSFTRLFVPELFSKSAQEAFNATSEGAAIIKNSDMRHWNYGTVLANGTKVGYDKNIGPYTIVNQDGKTVKIPVLEQDVVAALNEDNIITSSVDSLYDLFDENGNISSNIIQNYNLGNLSQDKIIDHMINSYATKAADELYPESNYSKSERLYKRDELYRTLYKLLLDKLSK